MKKLFFLTALLTLAALAPMSAQIKTPAASPNCKVTQDVGLIKVDVAYSRPSAKGRKVFGELVPFGDLWRTGANASTKVTFGDDVKVGGTALAKGTYALYTVPGERQWDIVFYKNTSLWGAPAPADYKMEDVAAKVTVASSSLRDAVETFTIEISNLKNDGATIDLMWENTAVSLPLEVNVDSKVMANIDRVMAGPSAGDYYNAASYYHDAGKDLKKAYEWVKKANEMQPRFWTLRKQSLIEADLGLVKEAIATAEKSKTLAKEAGNNEYVQMNEKSIAEWSKKKM